MPETAPAIKVAGVRKWGGEVVLAGRTSEDRHRAAEAIAAREGLAVVPPFDHPDIVAGPAAGGAGDPGQAPGGPTGGVPGGRGGASAPGRGGARRRGGEPAGAATTAALRSRALQPRAPTVLVVSGGNVDPSLLES